MSHHVRLVPTPLKSPTKTNNCHPGFSFFFEKNWRVIGTSHDAEGFNQLIKSTAQNLPFLYGSLYLSSQHLPTLTSLSLLKFHSFLSLSIYKFLHHHSPSCTREREREKEEMTLGKRPRPPMKRTTSMTEITFDLLSSPQPSDPNNVVDPRSTPAPVSPGNRRRNSVDVVGSGHFLRCCSLCKRRLVPGHDIYMYRYVRYFLSQ